MTDKLPSVALHARPSDAATTKRVPKEVSTMGAAAYAAPTVGGFFFYIPMWSILPGVYSKYFGLSLTSIAAVVLFIRLFDGIVDTTIGYLSDWHRTRGGSRKPWVVVGSLGVIIACYFLFQPPQPTSTAYYLAWSMVYFLAFTIAEIPHLTWGSELSLDYQKRAQVFGMRVIMTRLGVVAFYAMPLLPIYSSTDYTPEVLKDAIYAGALMTVVGLAWMLSGTPAGVPVQTAREDSWRLFMHSLVHNKPLLLYFSAYACIGLCAGMWYGLVFFYLDTYLGLGSKVALIFMLATALSALSTPLWLKLIQRTSKSTVWAIGIIMFCTQMLASLFLAPGASWWIPFGLILIANLFFSSNDVASPAILADIVDYGKLKFHKDRGATYFGFNTLIFKIGLGLGGGLALGIAGIFGFDPSHARHSDASILGLKIGFIILPICMACVALVFILVMPIDRRRHRIIQRRIESRQLKSGEQPSH